MVTIKDIARMAQVSIGTVDRVIHNRGRFSESTREKVEMIIRETGYKTNIIASQLVKARIHTFGIIMPYTYQNDSYWRISKRGMEQAKEELAHFKINFRFYFYDRYLDSSFIDEYKRALEDENDGFLIAPVLSRLVEKYLNEYPPRIPYVLFNADIPHCNKLSFIGQDSFLGGMTSGKLMSVLIQNRGSLAVIVITPPDYHINIRASGFQAFFKNNPLVSITQYSLPDIEEFNAFDALTKKILDENLELKGIFVPNASTHYFADAIAALDLKQKIHIIGYDLIKENIRCLKKGLVDFIINQQPLRQGYEGIMALYSKIVLRIDVGQKKLLPIEIITRENLDSYIQHYSFAEAE
jgi:LacI family transcriptional regulator